MPASMPFINSLSDASRVGKACKKKKQKTRRCFEENLMKFQKISVFTEF